MCKIVSDVVVFLAVSLCLQSTLGFAFNIEINPKTVNGLLRNDVSITCRMDNKDYDVKEVIFIDVYREGKPVAVFRHDSKLIIAKGMEDKFKAQGSIQKTASASYLNVTMSNPSMADSGEFTCLLYYLDDISILKEKKASANFSVTDKEVTSALRYLVDQVSALSNKSKELQEQVVSLTRQLEDHEKKENLTVMFTAIHTTSEYLQNGTVLIYETVVTNEGQGYNSSSGIFTAPMAGYYLFQLSVVSWSGKYVLLDLKSTNGQQLMRMSSGDSSWTNYSEGSCLAKLAAGVEVKPVVVYTHENNALYHYQDSDHLNQFSGYLIKTL